MPKPAKAAGDTTCFTSARFGMFIHQGLCALPARPEWVESRERITEEISKTCFGHFKPDCNLRKQTAWAEGAGMRYMVLRAKHREEFCR